MPAGGLDFALGAEHREQSGFDQPDAIYPANESAGVPSGAAEGDFDVDEVYGEIQVPILKDAPLADLLQLSAAIRCFDYSTFGSDTTSKFGLNWRPVKDLLVRGTFGEGFRAPGIGELFGTFSRFDATLDDPCSDFPAAESGWAHGPTPGRGPGQLRGHGDPRIPMRSSIPRSRSSRAAIRLWCRRPPTVTRPGWSIARAGRSDTSWSETLEFEFTYYKIEISDTIQARDAQAKLDGCAANLDSGVVRGHHSDVGPGVISGFNNTLINIGGTDTSGYDLNVHWRLPMTGLGQFTFSWQNTILDEYVDNVQTAAGFVEVPREGTERGSPSVTFPEWKSALTADWTLGDFSAARHGALYRLDHGAMPSDSRAWVCAPTTTPSTTASRPTRWTRPPTWICREVVAVRNERVWTFTLGVNNVLDEEPPFCFSCELNSFDGGTYDVPGMFWYGRVVARFGNE